jgi:hypothetical protein
VAARSARGVGHRSRRRARPAAYALSDARLRDEGVRPVRRASALDSLACALLPLGLPVLPLQATRSSRGSRCRRQRSPPSRIQRGPAPTMPGGSRGVGRGAAAARAAPSTNGMRRRTSRTVTSFTAANPTSGRAGTQTSVHLTRVEARQDLVEQRRSAHPLPSLRLRAQRRRGRARVLRSPTRNATALARSTNRARSSARRLYRRRSAIPDAPGSSGSTRSVIAVETPARLPADSSMCTTQRVSESRGFRRLIISQTRSACSAPSSSASTRPCVSSTSRYGTQNRYPDQTIANRPWRARPKGA